MSKVYKSTGTPAQQFHSYSYTGIVFTVLATFEIPSAANFSGSANYRSSNINYFNKAANFMVTEIFFMPVPTAPVFRHRLNLALCRNNDST
jgi:hypothetical protein